MEKITLKEALKQASVVDELKNFVGLTKDDALGLMTPERLAAVAGGLILRAKRINTGDLNDYKKAGFLFVGQENVLNKPANYVYIAVLSCVDSKDVLQIAYDIAKRIIYLRSFDSLNWLEWKTIS